MGTFFFKFANILCFSDKIKIQPNNIQHSNLTLVILQTIVCYSEWLSYRIETLSSLSNETQSRPRV